MNLRCGTTTAVLTMLVLTSSGTAMSQERFPDPPPGHGLYSDAVQVGDLVFLSGVVSGDPDPAQQFRSVFERIDRILQEAGSGLDRIVDMTTYHVDMHSHIQDFIDVKSEYVPNLPSWTAVGVTELYSQRAFVEVKVIAAVGDGG
jgi:enamine deaminase RidA (YjgF/YER057c/UK114 family)